MENKHQQVRDSFEYLPVFRYKRNRSNFFVRIYASAVELVMNSFGKKKTYFINRIGGASHLKGRGDVPHRIGGILSVTEHDKLIALGDKNRKANLEFYNKKNPSKKIPYNESE